MITSADTAYARYRSYLLDRISRFWSLGYISLQGRTFDHV